MTFKTRGLVKVRRAGASTHGGCPPVPAEHGQFFVRGEAIFWTKKEEPNPLGVPLSDLKVMLQPTSIKASLKGNTLTARHEHYTIRIEVVPPET